MKFSKINRKNIEAKFTGGSISSDGGLLLLREVDKQIRLTEQVSNCICDNRHLSYIKHEVKTLLRQRIYGIAAISQEMVESFIRNYKGIPEELVLDFDPTDNKIYGKQENRHYHGYYKDYCYFPLHVFCKDQLIVSIQRSSDIDGAKYAGAILKLLVKRFREAWTNVKIIFRADSGFARKRILYWCENNNVEYIVGMPSNSRLQTKTRHLVDLAKKDFEITREKQKTFDDFKMILSAAPAR